MWCTYNCAPHKAKMQKPHFFNYNSLDSLILWNSNTIWSYPQNRIPLKAELLPSPTLMLSSITDCCQIFVKLCFVAFTKGHWTKMKLNEKEKWKKCRHTDGHKYWSQNQLSFRHVPPTLLSEALQLCHVAPGMNSSDENYLVAQYDWSLCGVHWGMFCICSWIPEHPMGQGES